MIPEVGRNFQRSGIRARPLAAVAGLRRDALPPASDYNERLDSRSVVMVEITGVILSGGQGSRMGGRDKGLQPFRGRTLIEWVLERIEPQVSEVLISANQNLERYLAFGHPVLTDRITGFAGPLAGLHAAMSQARCELVVTVPCDSPFLPGDLVRRLAEALEQNSADVAVARSGAQSHPVFCLCRASLLPHLTTFLAGSERKVDAWQRSLQCIEVRFDDQPQAFRNVNTLDELRALD
jgi:molybdenum cofactor guanylyltransferase